MANESEMNDDLRAILDTAKQLVTQARSEDHGNAYDQHALASKFWNIYLHGRGKLCDTLKPHDVAQMMLLLKVSRGILGKFNPDTFIDQCGYAALTYGILKEDKHADRND